MSLSPKNISNAPEFVIALEMAFPMNHTIMSAVHLFSRTIAGSIVSWIAMTIPMIAICAYEMNLAVFFFVSGIG